MTAITDWLEVGVLTYIAFVLGKLHELGLRLLRALRSPAEFHEPNQHD